MHLTDALRDRMPLLTRLAAICSLVKENAEIEAVDRTLFVGKSSR
jgi:hypothetical protein